MSEPIVYELRWRYGWYGQFAAAIAMFYISFACRWGLLNPDTAMEWSAIVAFHMVRLERAK